MRLGAKNLFHTAKQYATASNTVAFTVTQVIAFGAVGSLWHSKEKQSLALLEVERREQAAHNALWGKDVVPFENDTDHFNTNTPSASSK